MQQILWFEVLLKAGLGAVLLLLPMTSVRLAGLERPQTAFWVRVTGGTLLGLAVAVFIPLHFPEARGGLGPAGLVSVNLGAAAGLLVSLIMGYAAPTRRGWLVILTCTLVLLTSAFLEIAHI